jgi:hypothetical protein
VNEAGGEFLSTIPRPSTLEMWWWVPACHTPSSPHHFQYSAATLSISQTTVTGATFSTGGYALPLSGNRDSRPQSQWLSCLLPSAPSWEASRSRVTVRLHPGLSGSERPTIRWPRVRIRAAMKAPSRTRQLPSSPERPRFFLLRLPRFRD